MRIQTSPAPFLLFGRYQNSSGPAALDGPARTACFNCFRVLDGTLTLQQGRRRWQLRPGEAAITDPGVRVSWGGPIRMIRLAFDLVPRERHVTDKGYVDALDWQPQPSWQELFELPLPDRIDPTYLASTDLLLHRLASTYVIHPIRHFIAHAELAEFVAGYVRLLNDTHKDPHHPGIATRDEPTLANKLEVILLQHFATGISLTEAAAMLGFSTAYVSRRYRNERGITPSRYLQKVRVEHACKMIQRDPAFPLDTVAQAVGLAGAHSLNRAFAAVIGQSPSAWRRQHGL